MKKTFKLLICLLMGVILPLNAQVRISDTNNTAPAANAILELHSGSGNKGIIPPTAALTSLTDASTIASPTAGMLIYRPSGSAVVPEGYYTWDGAKWLPFATGVGSVNVVTKIATGTIAKTETFIVASGDITLTLPIVTSADNGLAITVKNVGTHTDVVQVDGNGVATIDGITATSKLYRWKSRTFIAYNGNWIKKEKEIEMSNTFDVGPNESWTTIPEILEFLDLHITVPSVVRLDGGT